MEAMWHCNRFNKFLTFPVLWLCLSLVGPLQAQEKYKNQIGLSFDVIHTITKAYNRHQLAFMSSYQVYPGITLQYDRIIKEKFFVGAKLGYYYINQKVNFPGEFPMLNHSMKNIGQVHLDAVPIGINTGYIHNISDHWSFSLHMGLNSYLLYRPIPSGPVEDISAYLTREDYSVLTRIFGAVDIYLHDFLHNIEFGHTLTYHFPGNRCFQLFLNNHLRVGFRPYLIVEMLVSVADDVPNTILWQTTSSITSNLFFTTIGFRYGF